MRAGKDLQGTASSGLIEHPFCNTCPRSTASLMHLDHSVEGPGQGATSLLFHMRQSAHRAAPAPTAAHLWVSCTHLLRIRFWAARAWRLASLLRRLASAACHLPHLVVLGLGRPNRPAASGHSIVASPSTAHAVSASRQS